MVSKKWISTWLILNFFIFWSVGLYTSGYSLEGYLPWESEEAENYGPIVYTPPNDLPDGILYMVDWDGSIYYYIVWEDEYFDNWLIDRLYRFFRALVYGGATQDIEVVKVFPDNRTVYFQTYEHTDVWAIVAPNESCTWLEKDLIVPDCAENGTHVKVYSVTWNHMLSLIPQEGTVRVILPMRRMTPADYVILGMFRRTQHTIAGVAINSLFLALVATVVFNSVMYVAWRKGYLTKEGQRKIRNEIRDGWRKLKERLKKRSK
ncbi:hypothetical protein E3E38_05655 [Thermococcus sp. 18S1]|uniref:hypothetical protein n=1 Tax=Thermococcus sp. 18S1 TaxID=1638210 RepID=UPI00143922CB|nr:hypothetical protein [Thermococcus sp. 18S1]NJE30535.1 hypothetical protein [Thermococcus sp. 18S1]